MLEHIRTQQSVTPADMITLRECIESAREILMCPHCPKRFLSIIQNVSILGTLCFCITDCYSRILRSVDAEEQRAFNMNEQKQLEIRSSIFASVQGNDSAASFQVEMTPSQWKAFMRNTVKSEVFGVHGSREKCFWAFLDNLEDRQKHWHEMPDCDPTYRSDCTPDNQPLCILTIKEVRKMVKDLNL